MQSQEIDRIYRVIRERYKDLDEPDFRFVQDVVVNNPYLQVVDQISNIFATEEDTDLNYDVSFGYVLTRDSGFWALRLSMLAPYAVLLRADQEERLEPVSSEAPDVNEAEQTLLTLLREQGITVLDRATLDRPVTLKLFNASPANTRIYQALFFDTDVLPWT